MAHLASLTALVLACVAAASPSRQQQPLPPAPNRPLLPKILIVQLDPIIESEGGKRLHEVCSWHDPATLAKGYMSDLTECSRGMLKFDVVETIEADAFPLKKDGFRYTDADYLKCARGEQPWHQPDAIDYQALIKEYRLAERVEAGEIDEAWFLAMPYSGFYESTMAGKGAYYCNSDPVPDVAASRIFIVMGFNYERGVGEMLEDFGHRTESILTHVFGRWENDKHPLEDLNPWERFTIYDKQLPGKAACGNVHFAPNSEKDYDWGNKRIVMSTCDEWLKYPALKGVAKQVNCEDWGGGDIRLHHKWWLAHLPAGPGATSGRMNNWWRYAVDFNAFPESRE